MLNYKVESLEGVDENLHSLYEQKDGAYFLKVSGVVSESDVDGLKASRDALLTEKKEAQRLKDEAEAERLRVEREALEADAKAKGNWEALDKSYQEREIELKRLSQEREDALRKQVYKLTVGDQALKMASEISKPHAQGVLTRFIEERLTLDESGNVRVLDMQGKPSAMTIEDLKTEFKNNAMFQDIVVVNNASGGGASGGGFGGGAAKKPSEMTEQERRDLFKSDPTAYRQLFGIK